MNAALLTIAVLVSAPPQSFEARLKRWAVGYQESNVPSGKVDRLVGLDCTYAFLIHPKSEKPPVPVKLPLKTWVRSQQWINRVVVMDFNDAEETGDETKAKDFADRIWPTIQGQQSLGLKMFRMDTTVVWGDEDAIEGLRR